MDRERRLEQLFAELGKEPGVLGLALVSRDGLCVRATGRLALSRETFSAMAATAMGAAEIAISELDGGRSTHLVTVTDRLKLIVMGVTRDLLLVACTQADAAHDRLLPRLESAAQTVALVSSGG